MPPAGTVGGIPHETVEMTCSARRSSAPSPARSWPSSPCDRRRRAVRPPARSPAPPIAPPASYIVQVDPAAGPVAAVVRAAVAPLGGTRQPGLHPGHQRRGGHPARPRPCPPCSAAPGITSVEPNGDGAGQPDQPAVGPRPHRPAQPAARPELQRSPPPARGEGLRDRHRHPHQPRRLRGPGHLRLRRHRRRQRRRLPRPRHPRGRHHRRHHLRHRQGGLARWPSACSTAAAAAPTPR